MAIPGPPQLQPGAGPTYAAMNPLVNPGLSIQDDQRVLRPVLAEAVPSLENGLWTLHSDGRMEATWTIRSGARWHDGVPLTTDDLLFTLQVGRDLPSFGNPAYAAIQEVVVVDARTVTVWWKEPFIEADRLFGYTLASPLPRHRLEEASRGDPASFLQLSFWAEDYVGAGPFRVRHWAPGVEIVLEAVPDYVLGRPQVDEIHVKIIPDASALMANLLAGAVDMAPVIESIDSGVQIRERWRDGAVTFSSMGDGWVALFPQFVNPQPAVVADVRFRRALLHAMDRQAMVDTLAAGLSPVPHSFMSPDQPQYQEIEARLPRYDYDPRRAAEMIEELGYRKGSDGVYRDSADAPLHIELRSTPLDEHVQAAEVIRDQWRRLGLAADTPVLRPDQVESLEARATFPAFQVRTNGRDEAGIVGLHSSRARLPDNNFRVPAPENLSRYMNPELDALVERYRRTVPMPERTQVLGEILSHVANLVVVAGIYYRPAVIAVASRVENVKPAGSGRTGWNSHEWDVKG